MNEINEQKQKFIDLINLNFDENNTISDIKSITREWDYNYIKMVNGDGFIIYDDGIVVFDENENE